MRYGSQAHPCGCSPRTVRAARPFLNKSRLLPQRTSRHTDEDLHDLQEQCTRREEARMSPLSCCTAAPLGTGHRSAGVPAAEPTWLGSNCEQQRKASLGQRMFQQWRRRSTASALCRRQEAHAAPLQACSPWAASWRPSFNDVGLEKDRAGAARGQMPARASTLGPSAEQVGGRTGGVRKGLEPVH